MQGHPPLCLTLGCGRLAGLGKVPARHVGAVLDCTGCCAPWLRAPLGLLPNKATESDGKQGLITLVCLHKRPAQLHQKTLLFLQLASSDAAWLLQSVVVLSGLFSSASIRAEPKCVLFWSTRHGAESQWARDCGSRSRTLPIQSHKFNNQHVLVGSCAEAVRCLHIDHLGTDELG